MRRLGRLIWIALLLLLGASRAGAADGQANFADLVKEGRYAEAYQALAPEGRAPDAAHLAEAARALLGAAIQSPHEPVRWPALRLARTLKDQKVAAAARTLAREGGRYEKSLALEILANNDLTGNRDIFVEQLDSPFRSVRLRALRALAQLRDPSLVDQFAALLASDADLELRAFAARALGDTGSKQALPPLWRALDDASSLVREETVRALVALGDTTIAGALRRRLADAPGGERRNVIRLIALIPDPTLASDLAPLLGDDDAEVRALAAAAILSVQEPVLPEAR